MVYVAVYLVTVRFAKVMVTGGRVINDTLQVVFIVDVMVGIVELVELEIG